MEVGRQARQLLQKPLHLTRKHQVETQGRILREMRRRKQRRLDKQSPTSEPLQWKTETNILPPRRRKVKKVRVRKKVKEENRSWGGPVLALPLIAPRPHDEHGLSDQFRDVDEKLRLPTINKKGEFLPSITDAPAASTVPTMSGGDDWDY